MKRYMLYAFILTCVMFSSHPSECETKTSESLPNAIDEALNNNPSIREAYNKWLAAKYKIDQSMSLPDPTAEYTFFGESVETRVGPQEYKLGASQKIPLPPKLGLKGRVSSRTADILKEEYEARKREVIKDVKFVYYDTYWVDRAIQITEEEKSIMENLESVARRKYESNLATAQDPIKAEVEISKLIDRLFMLKQNRKSLEAKMISILNRPGRTQFGAVETIEPVEFPYSLGDLHIMSEHSQQELIAARLGIERANYEKSLAQFDYLPDVTFGFQYIEVGKGHTMQPNDGQDAWMGTVAINVPIWIDRLDAQFKEKKMNLESMKDKYQAVENDIYYEIEDIYFKVLTYRDIITLYKTALVPQTEQGFEAARTGYETGRVDFLNWLDAEKTLLQTKLAYYKAIVDYLKSIAYLERMVGRAL